jgi:hypothetical protein
MGMSEREAIKRNFSGGDSPAPSFCLVTFMAYGNIRKLISQTDVPF